MTSAVVGQALALELLLLPVLSKLGLDMISNLAFISYLIGVNSSVTSSKNAS